MPASDTRPCIYPPCLETVRRPRVLCDWHWYVLPPVWKAMVKRAMNPRPLVYRELSEQAKVIIANEVRVRNLATSPPPGMCRAREREGSTA